MTLKFNLLANPIQAHSDLIQEGLEKALEQADEACDVADEAARAELSFEVLLKALSALPDQDKAHALSEAIQGKATSLLADICIRFLGERTIEPLQHAANCAHLLNDWKSIKRHLTLSK